MDHVEQGKIAQIRGWRMREHEIKGGILVA